MRLKGKTLCQIVLSYEDIQMALRRLGDKEFSIGCVLWRAHGKITMYVWIIDDFKDREERSLLVQSQSIGSWKLAKIFFWEKAFGHLEENWVTFLWELFLAWSIFKKLEKNFFWDLLLRIFFLFCEEIISKSYTEFWIFLRNLLMILSFPL